MRTDSANQILVPLLTVRTASTPVFGKTHFRTPIMVSCDNDVNWDWKKIIEFTLYLNFNLLKVYTALISLFLLSHQEDP